MSCQVYLSTSLRKKRVRSVPFSRITSARALKRRVVHQQAAALPGDDVLRLVEAVGAQVAEAAQGPSLVAGHDPLRAVFHHLSTRGRARSP
jgi:hypothetical protein